jgi:tRNA G18 (ribose-2'-O)-methylase SpoU
MPLIRVDALDHPLLEPYRELIRTNWTRHSGRFIAESALVVQRLLASRYPVESVLASNHLAPQIAPLVPSEVPLLVADVSLLREVAGYKFHRGVLACGRRLADPTLEEIAGRAGPLLLVVCPLLLSPENLGGILRTSSVLGADGVLLGRRCGDPFSRRVLRTSMATALRMPVRQPDDLLAEVRRLRDEFDVELLATVADDATHDAGAAVLSGERSAEAPRRRPLAVEPLDHAARPPRMALLLGSEGFGLEPPWLELCHRAVTIPMRGVAMQRNVDSLNVTVAAGICLYHFARQDPRLAQRDPCVAR